MTILAQARHVAHSRAGLMTRSVPQAQWPAPEGAVFDVEGPARTLNRRPWFHVQAMKADKPRLSACTGKGERSSPPFRVRFFCCANFAGRSYDHQHEQVGVRGSRASP